MRILLMIVVAFSTGTLLSLPVETSAHGTDPRGGHMDEQMKKLHAIMPMLSIASAELESAIEKGDAPSANSQADRILAAVPDLKKSRPHKNIKQRKEFITLASKLEEAVTATANMVQKRDFTGAKNAFLTVEKICVACHAKFRD